MTNAETLVLAIAENNPEKFQAAVTKIGLEKLLAYRFEHNMNVLNLAIDMESVEIVREISKVYKEEQTMLQSMVNHRYAKEM